MTIVALHCGWMAGFLKLCKHLCISMKESNNFQCCRCWNDETQWSLCFVVFIILYIKIISKAFLNCFILMQCCKADIFVSKTSTAGNKLMNMLRTKVVPNQPLDNLKCQMCRIWNRHLPGSCVWVGAWVTVGRSSSSIRWPSPSQQKQDLFSIFRRSGGMFARTHWLSS